MRIGAAILAIWLVIGIGAAAQRSYFTDTKASCAKVSTTALTIVAGPANYVGANPKITCKTPQPSA